MVYEAQRKVILELAEKESCVIIGRNADFILRDWNDVLNVFIHGDMPEKIQRIMDLHLSLIHIFITRIVGVLPGDIVSLYFGACNTRYDIYLIAGVAGSLLSIVTTTILGEKISHPFSIGFFVVLLLSLIHI